MTSQAAVDYTAERLIKIGLLAPREREGGIGRERDGSYVEPIESSHPPSKGKENLLFYGLFFFHIFYFLFPYFILLFFMHDISCLIFGAF